MGSIIYPKKPKGFRDPRPRIKKSKLKVGDSVLTLVSLFVTGLDVGAYESGRFDEVVGDRILVNFGTEPNRKIRRGWVHDDLLERKG